MFAKSKAVFVAACFLFLLSFNLNAASNKVRAESLSLGRFGEDSFSIPVGGDKVIPTDYSDVNNWLALPKKEKLKKVDVFFIYPTAWSANGWVSRIRHKRQRNEAGSQELFKIPETSGNIFAPYYRQLDASYAAKAGFRVAHAYFQGVPKTDIIAAFDYYVKNLNEGRPFILAGHSQGSIMIAEILSSYMKANPKGLQKDDSRLMQ